MPPTMSFAAMATTMMTMASSSVAVVSPMSHTPQMPPPGLSALPGIPSLLSLLPTPLAPGQILVNTGVGRGHGLRSQGVRQPATGLCQVRPSAAQQQTPTSRPEAGLATPYRQQVYPPHHTTGVRTATTQASTTPSSTQEHGAAADEGRQTRGRSSS